MSRVAAGLLVCLCASTSTLGAIAGWVPVAAGNDESTIAPARLVRQHAASCVWPLPSSYATLSHGGIVPSGEPAADLLVTLVRPIAAGVSGSETGSGSFAAAQGVSNAAGAMETLVYSLTPTLTPVQPRPFAPPRPPLPSNTTAFGPRARFGHVLVCDPVRGRVLLYGGCTPVLSGGVYGPAQVCMSSLWTGALTLSQAGVPMAVAWTMLGGDEAGSSRPAPVSTDWPRARAHACVSVRGDTVAPSAVFMVGGVAALAEGFGTRALMNDVWILDLPTSSWRLVRPSSSAALPQTRFGCAVAMVNAVSSPRAALVVYGGTSEGSDVADSLALLSDTWVYVLDPDNGAPTPFNGTWVAVPTASWSQPRSFARLLAVDDALFMLNGVTHMASDSSAGRSVWMLAGQLLLLNVTTDVLPVIQSTVQAVPLPDSVPGWAFTSQAAGLSTLPHALEASSFLPNSSAVLLQFGVDDQGFDLDAWMLQVMVGQSASYSVVGPLSAPSQRSLTRLESRAATTTLYAIIAVTCGVYLSTLLLLGETAVLLALRVRERLCSSAYRRCRRALRSSPLSRLVPDDDQDLELVAAYLRRLELESALQTALTRGSTPEDVVSALPSVRFSSAKSVALALSQAAAGAAGGTSAFLQRSYAATADGTVGIDAAGAECSICLVDYSDADELHQLPCGHFFHAPCIQRWLRSSSKLCPMCKRSVLDPPMESATLFQQRTRSATRPSIPPPPPPPPLPPPADNAPTLP